MSKLMLILVLLGIFVLPGVLVVLGVGFISLFPVLQVALINASPYMLVGLIYVILVSLAILITADSL